MKIDIIDAQFLVVKNRLNPTDLEFCYMTCGCLKFMGKKMSIVTKFNEVSPNFSL